MSFFVNTKSYDVHKTLNCGQVFRYYRLSEQLYEVRALTDTCQIKQQTNGVEVCCNPQYNDYWYNYFNFDDTSEEKLKDMVKGHTYLRGVVEKASGLHILNQDPWECLISFIISQRKSIPQIKACIERLCRIMYPESSLDLLHFPQPHEVLAVQDRLKDTGVGYRAPYIIDAANRVFHNWINLDDLRKMDTSHCILKLQDIHGVGVKVASCVALFSLGKTDAFPVDVRMGRLLARPELKGFNQSDYGECQGLLQQAMYFSTF